MAQTIPWHEMMEVHEILNFKTVCALKSKMMYGLAHDADLKELLELDVKQSMAAIQQLQALYARAPIQPDLPPSPSQSTGGSSQSAQRNFDPVQ